MPQFQHKPLSYLLKPEYMRKVAIDPLRLVDPEHQVPVNSFKGSTDSYILAFAA